MSDNIVVNGLTFAVSVHHDYDMGVPWNEHEGHGVVTEWTRRDKLPQERVLNEDRTAKRFYDVQESIKLATRDGWGLSPEDLSALTEKLGREPTKREIIAKAVDKDYQHLRAWCRDEWSWVYVRVTLLDVDGKETAEHLARGGIESTDSEGIAELAQDLADEIASRIADATELVKITRIRK